MTELQDAAYRDAQKQMGELYLAGHNDKHEMEQERAAAALEHNMERLADHRSRHEDAHESHVAQHFQEQLAVQTALTAKGLRDDDHRIAHARDHTAHETLHEQEQLAVKTALAAVAREREIHAAAHEREHVAHGQIHELAQRAVDKAEAAVDARLHEMNAVRDQLREQNASSVRIEAFETFKDERRHALTALEASIETRLTQLASLIATEREERRSNEGSRKGVSASIGWIIVAITLVGTILGIIIVAANFATGTP